MSLDRKPVRHGSLEENDGISTPEKSSRSVRVEDIGIPAVDKSLQAGVTLQAGELTLEESSAGGIGRHLGLVSTTLLM